ncbi:MAG: 50S ribosomal protein L6 [Nitrososphaerota archaeon]|nr:50S ribosomal protein L6 [Candidatus Calditenuis fumarioli]
MSELRAETTAKPKYAEEVVQIPEGVTVEVVDEVTIRVKGPLGELVKSFANAGIRISKTENGLLVRVYGRGKRVDAMIGTFKAVFRNMVLGVTKGFTYKLKVVQTHFPMNLKVQGNRLVIENFIGERYPRVVEILPGVKVTVKGEDVIVTGIDREAVGLVAGRIEQATKIRNKDLRKFLDGIYVYYKGVGIEK